MSYPFSPDGHPIRHVAGNAEAIIKRGNAITTLGEQMHGAADTLEHLKHSSVDDGAQKGKAIEKLRDSIDDSYKTLREAGDLYEPVGPVLVTYGTAIAKIKPLIDSYADSCEELWGAYVALPGDPDGRQLGMPWSPEPGSPEAEAQGDEDTAKKAAYDAYITVANQFDGQYDDWLEAFETAADGVHDKVSGSIKDGFWEFLDDLMEVLNWAALVIGVIALIVGGPFVLIAFALAAAVLLVASIQMFDSGKSWGERWTNLGFAVLGVIPFGKFSQLAGEATHLGKLKIITGYGAPLTATRSIGDNLLRLVHGQSIDDLTKIANSLDGLPAGRALLMAHLDVMGPLLQHGGNVAQGTQTVVAGNPHNPFNHNFFDGPDPVVMAPGPSVTAR